MNNDLCPFLDRKKIFNVFGFNTVFKSTKKFSRDFAIIPDIRFSRSLLQLAWLLVWGGPYKNDAEESVLLLTRAFLVTAYEASKVASTLLPDPVTDEKSVSSLSNNAAKSYDMGYCFEVKHKMQLCFRKCIIVFLQKFWQSNACFDNVRTLFVRSWWHTGIIFEKIMTH